MDANFHWSHFDEAGPVYFETGLIRSKLADKGVFVTAVGIVIHTSAVLGFAGTVGIMKVIVITISLKVREEDEEFGLEVTQRAERAYVS